MSEIEKQLEEYKEQILREVEAEISSENPVHKSFKYRNFVSRSKGRGRKRKIPTEVELYGTNISGYHQVPSDGSVKNEIDVHAEEVLKELPPGTDPVEEFLRLLRQS